MDFNTTGTELAGHMVSDCSKQSDTSWFVSRDLGTVLGPEAVAIHNTTCLGQLQMPRYIKEKTQLPQFRVNPQTVPKSCSEKQIVKIALSVWLLRSKIHRKEFRRKAN